MGLYLCVFDGDEELDGVEVGLYEDFEYFRSAVEQCLENSVRGSRFPILMLHSDCDGSWTPAEARVLQQELETIAEEFQRLPAIDWPPGRQREIAKLFRLTPQCLCECFIDVDGEILIGRLIELADLSQRTSKDILFQ